MKSIFTFIASMLLVSCSHLTPSEKIMRNTLVAGAIGAAIGQQRSTSPDQYSAAYGGLAAASAAVVGLIVYDPEQVPRKVQAENEYLRRQISEMQEPKVQARVSSIGRLPRDVQGLIRPGEWKVLALDQWIEDGENRLIHQDQAIELVPPALVPTGR